MPLVVVVMVSVRSGYYRPIVQGHRTGSAFAAVGVVVVVVAVVVVVVDLLLRWNQVVAELSHIERTVVLDNLLVCLGVLVLVVVVVVVVVVVAAAAEVVVGQEVSKKKDKMEVNSKVIVAGHFVEV